MSRLFLIADLQSNTQGSGNFSHSDWTRWDIANGGDLFHALQEILEVAKQTTYLSQAVDAITLTASFHTNSRTSDRAREKADAAALAASNLALPAE